MKTGTFFYDDEDDDDNDDVDDDVVVVDDDIDDDEKNGAPKRARFSLMTRMMMSMMTMMMMIIIQFLHYPSNANHPELFFACTAAITIMEHVPTRIKIHGGSLLDVLHLAEDKIPIHKVVVRITHHP